MPDKKKLRYDEDHSRVGSIKKREESLDREGTPWTVEDYDRGWTLYLDGRPEATVAKSLKRSRRSVETKLWHHVFDPKDNPAGVIPRYLGGDRNGKHWDDVDDHALDLCLKHNWTVQAIATLLARSPAAVQAHVEKRQARGGPRMFQTT